MNLRFDLQLSYRVAAMLQDYFIFSQTNLDEKEIMILMTFSFTLSMSVWPLFRLELFTVKHMIIIFSLGPVKIICHGCAMTSAIRITLSNHKNCNLLQSHHLIYCDNPVLT